MLNMTIHPTADGFGFIVGGLSDGKTFQVEVSAADANLSFDDFWKRFMQPIESQLEHRDSLPGESR